MASIPTPQQPTQTVCPFYKMLLLFILFQSVTIIYTKTIYFDEVCDITGRRIYLELSENGLLTSRNETTKNFLCKQCNLEIITCPSCVINYKFK